MRLLFILCLITIAAHAADNATYNNQPVGPQLSPDDANGYIDLVVKNWIDSHPDQHKVDPQSVGTLAASAQRVGLANLEAAYGATAPDVAYHMNAPLDPQTETKRVVLEKAISSVATATDIEGVLSIYATRPLILEVLDDHAEWDADARVADFVVAHLDAGSINDAYKASVIAPLHLLILAARSHVPAVQDKLEALLIDLTQNSGSYQNTHVFTDLIATAALTNSATILKHVPDLLVTLSSRAHFPPSNIYSDVQPYGIFSPQLAGLAMSHPALFVDQATKDAALKLVDQAGSSTSNANVLIVAAACGRKEALVQLAAINNPTGKKYLAMQPGITEHIDAAAYDPAACTWSIKAAN